MTCYELVDRMCVEEILEWIDYDESHYDPDDYRLALLLTKIDAAMWTKGRPKPDHKKYLKKIKKAKPKRSENVQQLKQRLDLSLGVASPETFGMKSAETNGRQQ
jgi:hypothetical protein